MKNNQLETLILYANLGILLVGEPITGCCYSQSQNNQNIVEGMALQLSYQQNHYNTYEVVCGETPRNNYKQRYAKISKSNWFNDLYFGKSLGDFITVDF